MVTLRKLAILALIGFGALVATASSAGAAQTIGSTAPSGQSQDCFQANLFVQTSSAGASYVAPSRGVITSWSVHGFGQPARLTLKIVRETTVGNYLIKGSSREETVAPSGTTTFSARLSVAAGDEIALWTPGGDQVKAPCNYFTGEPLDVQSSANGTFSEPAVGSEFGPTSSPAGSRRLNLSAELEADNDQDGYGDETQDACPADAAATQAPCPDRIAPETTITKAPKSKLKTKKKRAKVKFAFRSSETSTFSCTLDGKTKRCSSPFKAKVKVGKHRFSVAATDSAGNDGTRAKVAFQVKRKRR